MTPQKRRDCTVLDPSVAQPTEQGALDPPLYLSVMLTEHPLRIGNCVAVD
jgi:hypothetical protein